MKLLRRLYIFLFYWLYTSVQHTNATCYSSIKEDLVFVLDSSNSIWNSEWEEMLSFVTNLVEVAIPVGTRVGEVVFGTYSNIELGLDQYSDLSDIAYYISHYTRRMNGWTYTKAALQDAYRVFKHSWSDDRAKKLVLITDGMPTDNPCSYSSKLKAAGIDVLIVAVGDWISSSNMNCLVNNVKKNIIELGSFDQMMDAIDAVQEVICANDFHLNVIEVQPYTESSEHLSSISSSDHPRFIEIYNLGGEIDFYGIQLSGMYTGEITTSTIMEQGDILLISEDASLASDCTTNCVFHHWTGSVDNYEEQDQDGTINQGYNISVLYNNVLIQWARWIKDDGFPKVARGRSFELKLPASNNEVGANWRSSCDMGGSPGKPPATECAGCNDNADCRFQGDTNANCTADHVCDCSSIGYYPQGRTCDPLPTPSDCMVVGVSGVDGRYEFDWVQPAFIDSLDFMRIEVTFTLSGSYSPSILEYREKPPTTDFALDQDKLENVTIAAVFNKSDISYRTADIGCGVEEAPTVVPSRSPTKTPTSVPTYMPTLSPVPTVDSCQLQITSNADTVAVMWWNYNGNYVVNGVPTAPSYFVIRWGEYVASSFFYADTTSSTATVTLVASWNYTEVVATVTTQGYEDGGPVLSNAFDCTVVQATAPPVAYPVPAPVSCELDINAGGKLGIVTIVPPSTPYIVGNVTKTLGYLVRVESISYTDYNLGYDGTLNHTIVIPSSSYEVYGVSLGSEDGIHPESDEVKCKTITLSPTRSPTPAVTKYAIPPLASCEVLVNRGHQNNDVVVTISWVKGSPYEHDGQPYPLKGYKYKLGGTSDWIEVLGENTTTVDNLWKLSYADAGLTTYMVAIGQEVINEVQEYPDSSDIPCDLNTMDPTYIPTKAPSLFPTRSPTKIPTGAPTFDTPMAGFVENLPIESRTLYNCLKGDEGIEVQIYLNPAALLPLQMKWEIINSTGQSVTDIFNETSGIVSFGKYMVNYRTESPGCSETGGACIEEYDCLKHNGYDYCVKKMGEVYEKIYISAKDDGSRKQAPERFSVVFSSPNDYVNNEFYYNASEYSIDNNHNNATILLYDAGSPEFCKASPDSAACAMSQHFVMKTWYWFIVVIVAICLILAICYARYKSTEASRAKREKNIASEMLNETLLAAEVGTGAGTTSRINPLALGKGGYIVNDYIAPSAVDDDEYLNDQPAGFTAEKNQFVPT